MRVDRVYLRHIGPFEDATIALPPPEKKGLADVHLLTGPNGSGKSTLLYAIADVLASDARLGKDLSAPRLRTKDSIAGVDCGGAHRVMAWSVQNEGIRSERISDPFGEGNLRATRHKHNIGYYRKSEDHPLHQSMKQAAEFPLQTPPESRPRFSWAAFAYAGLRDVSEVRVEAPSEPTGSPFENSLSFVHTADTQRLAQWVANQNYKRLKAKDAGLAGPASQLEKSIRDIETIISDITGMSFAFAISHEDSDIRVRLDGRIMPLGLMPDGLKSIVSWIADLLMRLDRIPWVDDIPPLERSFLLLLDEVDVHLHPAWQRKVLPIVQRVFPNAQIIASTHSPFVICSLNHGWIHSLDLNEEREAIARAPLPASEGDSFLSVLEEIMDVPEWYDPETEGLLLKFRTHRDAAYRGDGNAEEAARALAERIAGRSEELRFMMGRELSRMDRQLREAV